MNPILSFAPHFFNRLPPGHGKNPVKIVLKGGWVFFYKNEKYKPNSIEWTQFCRLLPIFSTGYPRDAQNSL